MIEKIGLFPNIIGIIFILTGLAMQVFPPKKINMLYGYRTPRSMKNIRNWNLAQQLSSKILSLGGFGILLIGLLGMILNLNEFFINMTGIIAMIAVVIFVFIKTESAIKKFEESL